MLLAPVLADRQPLFGEAWKAMFIATIAQVFAGLLLGMMFIRADETAIWPEIVGLVVGVLVLAFVLAHQLEATISRAILTALVMTVITFGLQMAYVVLFGGAGP